MKASTDSIRSVDRPRVALALGFVLFFGWVSSEPAVAAQSSKCDLQLTVELTPDVPDPTDAGFLSSLLNNHPGYRLELLRVIDPALLELDLSGPGPGYQCVGVINTIRKDARVLSVHSDTDRIQSSLKVPVSGTAGGLSYLRSTGIGSLYWAAHHPSQAWRVVLPIHSGERPWGNALQNTDTPAS